MEMPCLLGTLLDHLSQGGSEKFYFIMTMVAVIQWHRMRFLNFGVSWYTWYSTSRAQEARVHLFPTLLQWCHFVSLQLAMVVVLTSQKLANATNQTPAYHLHFHSSTPTTHSPCLEHQVLKHLPANHRIEPNLLEHIILTVNLWFYRYKRMWLLTGCLNEVEKFQFKMLSISSCIYTSINRQFNLRQAS